MGRKKIDKRICNLIKSSIITRHRSMFFILGKNSREQVVFLHHLLIKYRNSLEMKNPIPLWCFKKELGFNLYHNKKFKKMRKMYAGNYTLTQEDLFEHFLLSSNLQVCHYSETDSILGQTFGLLIIQDFEALTPNILARIIECVEGGGMIIFLLPNISSIEDIFLLNLDAHSRYVTKAYNDLKPLYNKRFVLSLLSCKNCLILDDNLKIKLLPDNFNATEASENLITKNEVEKNKMDSSASEDFNVMCTICCTRDQSAALRNLYNTLKNKNVFSIVSLTSSRGRGKSAVLGLVACLALNMHFSNIYLTAPHLENVQTLFAFLTKGLKSLNFVENKDFTISYSGTKPVNFITAVKLCKEHRQSVSYVSPLDSQKLGSAELVLIDEAAAIPLEIIKKWIGPYNICMASTINGYEGTGRSLSLKLINQLRNPKSSNLINQKQKAISSTEAHILHEITLNEAIRYSDGDNIEIWLNNLLCLDATTESFADFSLPQPEDCQLYYVNKNALFSFNKYGEKFLQQIVSLFVTSHYKNSPNDLLMMADAPAHHIFCLLPPLEKNFNTLPKILSVIQVSLEGKICPENYNYEQSHGRRASGDLIPWLISQQFQDENFASLSGVRVVRIATHPDCQSMGYGRHALNLLCQFYDGSLMQNSQVINQQNCSEINSSMQPLLMKLNEIPQEKIDYIGVSYGLTSQLLKFWKKSGFVPLYLRQTKSDVTGEYTCVMLKLLKHCKRNNFLADSFADFTSRIISLLPGAFNSLNGSLALSILHFKPLRPIKALSSTEMQWFIGPSHLKRLDAYCNNMIDHHLVFDLIPGVAKLYFSGHLNGYFLSSVQEVILLCAGLQHKSVEDISVELSMEVQQVMGCFRKTLSKILNCLRLLYQKN